MLKQVISFLSSTFLAKLTPVVLGYVLATELGNSAYIGFVSFVLFSGLISNISILGANPQIISLEGKQEVRNSEYFRITVCGLLFLTFCTMSVFVVSIFNFLPIYLIDLMGYKAVMVAFLYSLGIYFIYISTAKLNNALLVREASTIWFGYSAMTVVVAALWFLLDKNNLFLLVSLMAVSALIVGALGHWYAGSSSSMVGAMVVKEQTGYKKILRRQLSFSFFGFGVVGVFFYYQNALSLQSAEDGALFSLFYQLFALILFVPSTLGNIVVPRLVKKVKSGFPLKVYLYYFLIAFLLCVAIFGALPYLLVEYNIDMHLYSGNLFLTLLAVSLIAGVNSYSTQVLVAKKNYDFLMLSTALWASVALGLTAWQGISVQSVSVSLLAAYLVSSFGVVFGIYRLGYFKYFD